MQVDTRDTSRLSFDAISPKALGRKMQEVYDVVARMHQEGRDDVSLTELQQSYERWHEKRIDLNRVSARVYDLVNAKRLERLPNTRPCLCTGRLVHPVRAIAQQARLDGVQ